MYGDSTQRVSRAKILHIRMGQTTVAVASAVCKPRSDSRTGPPTHVPLDNVGEIPADGLHGRGLVVLLGGVAEPLGDVELLVVVVGELVASEELALVLWQDRPDLGPHDVAVVGKVEQFLWSVRGEPVLELLKLLRVLAGVRQRDLVCLRTTIP